MSVIVDALIYFNYYQRADFEFTNWFQINSNQIQFNFTAITLKTGVFDEPKYYFSWYYLFDNFLKYEPISLIQPNHDTFISITIMDNK